LEKNRYKKGKDGIKEVQKDSSGASHHHVPFGLCKKKLGGKETKQRG